MTGARTKNHPNELAFLLNFRLRLHVSRYPDIWISGCQRSGYLRTVYTCRIETFSAFTRVQTSGCIIYAVYSLCVGEIRKCFLFVKLHAFKLSSIFPFFLLKFVGWMTSSKFCLVSSVIDNKTALGPNHTQYKISLTFSYKTTFERELRPHTPSYVSFSYKSPRNCTTKQDAYKCRVPESSSAAGKRRNDKTCLSTPPRSLMYDVRYVNIFLKVVLTTSMTPYENVVLY